MSFLLTFVVPLRSREASRDWNVVERLCERTLSSIDAQTEQACAIVLVANEVPRLANPPARLRIVTDSFPIPANREEQLADKFLKLHRGMVEARRLGSSHVMAVDADDLVSSRIAGHVRRNPSDHGWFLSRGYLHEEGTRTVVHQKNFHRFCGSSAVVRCHRNTLPVDMDEDRHSYPLLRNGHHQLKAAFEEAGTPLSELPFPGAVYLNRTGENWAGFSLRELRSRRRQVGRLLGTRWISSRLRREFGLVPLPCLS